MQDIARCGNGDWLCVFHAGYWHLSMATPFAVEEETLSRWVGRGFPASIDAPQGGRILAIRSRDSGESWSRPEVVLNGEMDESPQGMTVLPSGRLLVFVNNQVPPTPPPLPVSLRSNRSLLRLASLIVTAGAGVVVRAERCACRPPDLQHTERRHTQRRPRLSAPSHSPTSPPRLASVYLLRLTAAGRHVVIACVVRGEPNR